MPRIREWKTVLVVRTLEPVTPDYLAKRVAQGTHALRAGESVSAVGTKHRYIIEDRSMLEAMGGWPPKS